jgi:phosphotransferase system  glucose/maltose/N-acetylglucosamine-specific IIC component
MSSYHHQLSLLAVTSLSVAFPVFVCFSRKRPFATWAKIASIIAYIAGLGWGFLSWRLTDVFISDLNYDYFGAYNLKGLFGGICIGLVFSIIIARPYVRRVA